MFVVGMFLALNAVGSAQGSGDWTELQKELEAALKQRQWAEAAHLGRRIEMLAGIRAPLELVDVAILNAPAEGLGLYSPAFKGEVRGDELYLYAQVRNHGVREVHGFFELHLVSDIVILDGKGKEIARDEGFGESRFSSRVPHRDTFVMIALRVKGLSAGNYRIRLKLHDKVGKKESQRDVPFMIRG